MYVRTRNFAQAILERVPKHAKILEIGCGDGQLTQLLRDEGCDVTALDPKPRAPFDVFAVRFEDFEAAPRSFDCIAAQLVLHHVDSLEGFLDKAMSLLKADGVLAIDDYGWERASNEVTQGWRDERQDLHSSDVMLQVLRKRFAQLYYTDHAYFQDGAGEDSLAFTFVGRPILVGGRERGAIHISESDAAWPQRYENERRRIAQALGSAATRIEHIGSTSVTGLAAKPIIDILVEVKNPHDEDIRAALERAGYQLRVHEDGHRMFRTPESDVHVHLWARGSPNIHRHIRFRDRLRANIEDRITYETVKRQLARRQWADMNEYAEAKSAIIAEILSHSE